MGGCRPGENPFRTSRIEALAYRDPDDPDSGTFLETLLERWNHVRRRGALVGPKGHGKTTLLEQLEGRLEERGWEIRRLRLRVETPTPVRDSRRRLAEGLHDRAVISVDGLELLRPWTWWRLRRSWRSVGGLLATTHRRGRLPTLHNHLTTPALLRSLVCELLDDEDFRRVDERLDDLFARHDGNVRECLRDLYDRFAAHDGCRRADT